MSMMSQQDIDRIYADTNQVVQAGYDVASSVMTFSNALNGNNASDSRRNMYNMQPQYYQNPQNQQVPSMYPQQIHYGYGYADGTNMYNSPNPGYGYPNNPSGGYEGFYNPGYGRSGGGIW